MTSVQFHLLGQVGARDDDGPVALGPARQRAVLATLLVEPRVLVTRDQLAERVWGTSPPPSARQTLHSYISRLRSSLGEAGGPVPVRKSGGYVLDVAPDAVDLHLFRALVTRARGTADVDAAAIWQNALALWEGVPFADLDSSWLRSVALTLQAEHHAATVDHHDVLLRLGQHHHLLPQVTAAATTHPLDERLAGQLMLALYRCGRQAEALEHYRQLQERLVDELGSDPGPGVRDLHQRILRHDPELTASMATRPRSTAVARMWVSNETNGGTRPRPAQLPLDVAGFTGRADDLRRLDELTADPTTTTQTVVITAIGGTAGVGKTALAVRWAHRAAAQFPDGQLYVNLRGYDPEQPARPADVLARFLAALGVPDREIPRDVDDRAARYRSELSDRRMLILLDNARTAAQVRPLLPGGGSSAVIVTSRSSLAGLAAVHGAHQIGLDLLTPAEAVDLLHRLIGDRVTDEPGAAATLAEQCARLPLALRVAAVRATSQPDRSLTDMTTELADRQERLELLDPGDDPYAAIHATFSWSVQHLPDEATRTFRRLGLHPGPDLDPYVATALAGLQPHRARQVLDSLVANHLLHRTGRGRYGMHDLLRAYAIRLVHANDSDQERMAAEQRLQDYYRVATHTAVSTLYPAEVQYQPDDVPDVQLPELSKPTRAYAWLQDEQACLMAIAEHGSDHGGGSYVLSLAQILYRHLVETNLTDLITINGWALRAAERAGDLNGQAHAQCHLGIGHSWMGRTETATVHLHRALALYGKIGDRHGQAHVLTNIASLDHQSGRHESAMDMLYQAISQHRQAGDRAGEAKAANTLGLLEEQRRNYDKAVELYQQALAIARELGLRQNESTTLNNLASVELHRGCKDLASEYALQSLAVAEELNSPTSRAHNLDTLGTIFLRLGDLGQAGECFQRALDHFRKIGRRGDQPWSLNGLGEVAQQRGNHTAALALHTEAFKIATDVHARDQQARSQAGIGHARSSLGESHLARVHLDEAYAIYAELGMVEAQELEPPVNEVAV